MSMLSPVILCGGSGTRLWPMSRALYPKQFMNLSGRTLFGDTLERCRPLGSIMNPIAVCNEQHRFYAAATLQEEGFQGDILLEPTGRNTAPAVALAAWLALERAGRKLGEETPAGTTDDNAPVLLVLPSDHLVRPVESFAQAVQDALPAAAAGYLVTFGITPTEPATGFGYIVRSGEERGGTPCRAISRFQEKPDAATAQALIDAGNCSWNSGMFLFRADIYLHELRCHAPAIFTAVRLAWTGRQQDHDFLRPDSAHFSACPADSVDYAVMEHTERGAVLPLSLEWNDLGSWEAFYQMMPKDADSNACVGDVIVKQSRNCYAHSTHRLVAALGLV